MRNSKLIGIVLLWVGLCVLAHAADPTYAACGTGQGTTSASVTCSPTATEALVAWVMTTAASTSTVTGFTSCGATQSTTNHGQLRCFYTCNVAGGSQTISATGVSTTILLVNRVQNALATNATACLDQYGGKANTSSLNPTVTTAGSVAQANEMVLGAVTDWDTNKTFTAGTGLTKRETVQDSTNGDSFTSETKNAVTGLSGTQTANYTATTGDITNLIVISIKGTAAGAAAVPTRSLMGVGTYGLPFGFFNPLPMLMGRD